uniref:Uncharacterized protein n=1 Tax=Felis catus TaxID=9685 RepID=A0ABI7XUR4_FELCA
GEGGVQPLWGPPRKRPATARGSGTRPLPERPRRTSAGATSVSGTSGTSRSIVPRATSSSAEGLVTCDSAARVKKRRLNQSTCTNSDIPLWLNTRKPPARKDGPLHHPTKDKTNRILYIMCGVLAIMLVGIFTKLGLEKAHWRQRKPSQVPQPAAKSEQGPTPYLELVPDLFLLPH